jgi:uncharacterized protein (TIGR02145 family)
MKPGHYVISLAALMLFSLTIISISCNKDEEEDPPNPVPCSDMPTVTFMGQTYNTIQIGDQCWMKENLNAGVMINSDADQADNDIIEKYCYDNDPANCDAFGGLYQWDEIMQYVMTPGTQGICPPGWHIPVDDEWKILEGMADSKFGIGDPTWDAFWYRGHDAGTHLKTTSGWCCSGDGTDKFGYSAKPGGFYSLDSLKFLDQGWGAFYWLSTDAFNDSWARELTENSMVYSGVRKRKNGYSIRCLRN